MDLKFDNLEDLRDAILRGLNANHKWVCYPVNKAAIQATDVVSMPSIKDANQFCSGKNNDESKAAYQYQPMENFLSFLENSLLHKAYPQHSREAISNKIDELNLIPVEGRDRDELLTLLSRGDFALVQVNKRITPIDHIKRYLVILHQGQPTTSKLAQNSGQTNILGGFNNYASAHKCFVESMPEVSIQSPGKIKKLFLAIQYNNVALELRTDGWPEAHTGTVLKTAQKEGEFVKVVGNTDPFLSCTVPQAVIARFNSLAGSVQFYDENLKLLHVLPTLKSVDGRFFDHTPLGIQQSPRLRQKAVSPPKSGRRPGPGRH